MATHAELECRIVSGLMNATSLGRTDLSLTALGFGAAPIGNLFTAVTDDEARDTLESAWSGGVRYFDTAPHYGLGLSERRVGEMLISHPRSEYVLSTKVGRLLRPNQDPQGSDLGSGGFATPDELTRVVDYSKRGVNRVSRRASRAWERATSMSSTSTTLINTSAR